MRPIYSTTCALEWILEAQVGARTVPIVKFLMRGADFHALEAILMLFLVVF